MIFLQSPFNDVTYALIGDGNSDNFFEIDEERGEISVKRELTRDGNRIYNVRNH